MMHETLRSTALAVYDIFMQWSVLCTPVVLMLITNVRVIVAALQCPAMGSSTAAFQGADCVRRGHFWLSHGQIPSE
jgi:hypothetical protein